MDHGLGQGTDETLHGIEATAAIREGTDPGQHDALGSPDPIGIGRDHDGKVDFGLAGGTLEGLGGRIEVAGAVIDDDDAHGRFAFGPPAGAGKSPITRRSTGSDAPRRAPPARPAVVPETAVGCPMK